MAAVFVAMQLIPSGRNVSAVPAGAVFVDSFGVDAKVNALLSAACYDCHSNNTRYPWYGSIRPVSWFMAGHIEKGKEKLNFDELPGYGPRRRRSKFTQIIDQIGQEKMPLESYQMLHGDARLSSGDRALLVEFFRSKIKDP